MRMFSYFMFQPTEKATEHTLWRQSTHPPNLSPSQPTTYPLMTIDMLTILEKNALVVNATSSTSMPLPTVFTPPTHPPTHPPTQPPTHPHSHPATHTASQPASQPLTHSPSQPATQPPTYLVDDYGYANVLHEYVLVVDVVHRSVASHVRLDAQPVSEVGQHTVADGHIGHTGHPAVDSQAANAVRWIRWG